MNNWVRVTHKNPCQVCTRDHWCLISEDGVSAICMRVQSDHPVNFKSGETGWIHRIADAPVKPVIRHRPDPVVFVNCDELLAKWRDETKMDWIENLAADLGVTKFSLMSLGFCWAKQYAAWAIPMSDGFGRTVGIRLRTSEGKKFCVAHTHSGIFLPQMEPSATAALCEGPTDTAAAISIGMYAIGRPSCSGGTDYICQAVKRLGIKRLVVLADADSPGIRGGVGITDHLPVKSCVVLTGAKDVREYVNMGGTAELIESMVAQETWRMPFNETPEVLLAQQQKEQQNAVHTI